MAETVTKQDLERLEKSSRQELTQALVELEQRLDAKIDHVVDVLEQKIKRLERKIEIKISSLQAELISHLDRRFDEMARLITKGLDQR